jgi:hypothetical protein
MKIEIPEGFFPPPGVAFSTAAQRNIALAMHNAGLIRLQYNNGNEWYINDSLIGNNPPDRYRLAPPTPRKVGPFESVHEDRLGNHCSYFVAHDAAVEAGFQRFRIHLTATAEEIL